ncbi:MAG: T9SS C-terminal target domain-containing protein [Bacteroidetes bacterium]|nr:MAG: T9SS C-terminal target domain-containing protein [Bacteroidota bacterium]
MKPLSKLTQLSGILSVLIFWILFQPFLGAQDCHTNYICGTSFNPDFVAQNQLNWICTSILEGSQGCTELGSISVFSNEGLTEINVCYYMEDGIFPTIPNIRGDSIPVIFTTTGLNTLIVGISYSFGINDYYCNLCDEVERDTFYFDVLPKGEFIITPNPTQNFWEVRTNTEYNLGNRTLSVYSLAGQFIKEYTFLAGEEEIIIDATPYLSGIYLFVLKTEDGILILTQKAVKI